MALHRHAVSVVLLALALALGAYLAFDTKTSETARGAREQNLLPSYRRSEVTAIAFEQGAAAARLVRSATDAGEVRYQLDGEPADPSAVDKLLGVLEFATWERRLTGELDRAALGLTAPRARVVVTMSGAARELVVGAPSPTPAGGAYLEVVGEGVFVVSRDLVTELTRPATVYRDRKLLVAPLAEVTELAVRRGGAGFTLSRGPWGGFGVEREGQLVRADAAAVERVLAALAELRAESFPADVDAESWLGAQDVRTYLTVTSRVGATSDAARVVIELGGRCAGTSESAVAVRRAPAPMRSACVPSGTLGPLSPAAAPAEDRRAFAARIDEIEALRLQSPSLSLELLRMGTGWHLRGPTDGAVDNNAGDAIVHDLLALEAETIVPEAIAHDIVAAQVRARAELTHVQAGPASASEKLEWGDPRGDWIYVRRLQDGALLKLRRQAVAVLEPSAITLRPRGVIAVPVASVEGVVIKSSAVSEVLRRAENGAFLLETPVGYSTDPALAHDIAETLAALSADRWVAEQEQPSFGLGSPKAVYELVVAGAPLRIEVGGATDGGTFARRVGSPGIFILGDRTRRQLETWAIDRSSFMIDPALTESVVLQRAGLRVELRPTPRPDDAGVTAEDPYLVALRVLSEVRALAAVHTGSPRGEEGLSPPELRVTVNQRGAPPYRMAIGRAAEWRDDNVFYARRDGVDATFVLPQKQLRALLELSSLAR